MPRDACGRRGPAIAKGFLHAEDGRIFQFLKHVPGSRLAGTPGVSRGRPSSAPSILVRARDARARLPVKREQTLRLRAPVLLDTVPDVRGMHDIGGISRR